MSLILIVLLSACGDSEENASANEGGESESSEGESMTLTVGGQSAPDNPITLSLMDYTDKIESETDGRIKFDVYPANQLGDYTIIYEEIMKGTIDMGLISIPSQFDARTEMHMMPYLIENYDQAEGVYGVDSFIYDKTSEIINEQGVELLGLRPIGFGGIGTTKPINDPTGLGTDKDVVTRIPQMDVYRSFAEEMGFHSVSIPWADIFTGLQTGTADGIIGAQPAANYLNFGDVINHYYQYNYSFETVALLINKDLLDSLSDKDRELLVNAGEEFTVKSFEEAAEIDENYLQEMRDSGIEVIEFSNEELKEMANYTREKVWPKTREALGDEIVDELMKISE